MRNATHHGMRNIYFAAFSLETINSRNCRNSSSKFSSSLSTAENVLSSSVSPSLEFHFIATNITLFFLFFFFFSLTNTDLIG